jgi:hypothetical protein
MKKILGYSILLISAIIFIAVFGAFRTILVEILKVFSTRFEIEQLTYTITITIGVIAVFFFAKFLWKTGRKLVNDRIENSK